MRAGVDLGFGPMFAAGASIEINDSEDFIDSFVTTTLRGTYTPSPQSGFGVYYSVETIDDFETTMTGIEGAYASPNGRIEVYYAGVESDVLGPFDIQSVGGISFEVEVGGGIALGIDYQAYTVGDFGIVVGTGDIIDLTVTDIALTSRYSFMDGASVYGKIGQVGGAASDGVSDSATEDDSTYFTIGAEYRFSGGTLFSPRPLSPYGF
ncbi:MAG: hypothetical protein ACSHW1_06705 [Yoonia sp.]|uniref:hypothetical protein n=1 Tax=Yoonia sp. TaxID=2212373 RepID=UPI003EF45572